MSDDKPPEGPPEETPKVVDIKGGKPFEIHVGDGSQPSPADVVSMLQKFLNYTKERSFLAVGIIMVDKDHSAITGYHMEAGVGTTLVGGCSYLALRINKFMDREDGEA